MKILIYDLEVSPILGWSYGAYKTNIIREEKQSTLLSISYKWLGQKKVSHQNIQSISEKQLVKNIHQLFDEADVVVAHNGNRFDNKVMVAKFIQYGLTPPSPYKSVDTLQVVRSVARFSKNGLDPLSQFLELGSKTETTHASLWYACLIDNDPKSWNKMKQYNNKDVLLLEKLYLKLRPYIKNHPNYGDSQQKDLVCPKCGSHRLQKRGTGANRSGIYQRYQCLDCGGWSKDASVRKHRQVSE